MLLPKTKPALDTRQKPGIVVDIDVLYQMQRGINQLVDALKPTLGPLPRLVAVERALRTKSPELLDSGGDLARRIIDLPNITENVGAMMVRGMVWKLHERVGDGTVTAAILFQSLYNQGMTYLAAGGNPMRLRTALEEGSAIIVEHLDRMTFPVCGENQLVGIAMSVCGDAQLAKILADVFHVIGEYGALEIRAGQRKTSYHEFVQGSYWSGGLWSSVGNIQRVEEEKAGILVTDLPIEDPHELVHALKAANEANLNRLFIISPQISPKVLAIFAKSRESDVLQIFPVRISETTTGLPHQHLEDIAILTGGQVLLSIAGFTWQSIKSDQIGRARRIWADKDYFGVIGGNADALKLRQQLNTLYRSYQNAEDQIIRESALLRIGKLRGGATIVHVGGDTESEAKYQEQVVKRTVSTLRAAIQSGGLPGGGVVLFSLSAMMQEMAKQTDSFDSSAGFRMLGVALEAPIRMLLQNAGIEPAPPLRNICEANYQVGYDLLSDEIIPLDKFQVFDVADVVKNAVQLAIHQVGLALTINTIIHRREPPQMHVPDGGGN